MPLILPEWFPHITQLKSEGYEIFDENESPDMVLTLINLMPQKQRTELQFFRVLWKTNKKIKIILSLPRWYDSKSTPKEYFEQYYHDINNVTQQKIHACIITGAPLEHLDFEEVRYWEGMKEIFEWTKYSVQSTLHICWGSMAGLYYHYGITKKTFHEKLFWVYEHYILEAMHPLMIWFDWNWMFPQARNAGSCIEFPHTWLFPLCHNEETWVGLLTNSDWKLIFLSGHPEYDKMALHDEFQRDLQTNPFQRIPQNYYHSHHASRWITETSEEKNTKVFFKNWIETISL